MAKDSPKTLIAGLGCHTPPADLLHLDPYLLPGGPQPGEVIEVAGSSNCGKSSLARHLIATALLPRTWRGIKILGCGAGVMYVDCDLHFSVLQLENMMQKRIKQSLRLGKDALKKKKKLGQLPEENVIDNAEELQKLLHSDKASLKAEIISLVKQCLKSFYYLRCTNSTQYAISLLSLDEYLMEQRDVSLVVVDSLSAFSWYDRVYRVKSWAKLKDYYNGIFTMVMASIKKYNVVLVATNCALFSKKLVEDNYQDKYSLQADNKEEEELKDPVEEEVEGVNERDYLGTIWAGSVTRRIYLSLLNTSDAPVERADESVASKDDADSSVNVTIGDASVNKSTDSTSVVSDSNRQLYIAEVIVNQRKTKLIYAIHEDGLRWQNG